MVNGVRGVGNNFGHEKQKGIVTKFQFRPPDRLNDQHGWGGRYPMEVVVKCRELAERAKIPHNIPLFEDLVSRESRDDVMNSANDSEVDSE